MSRLQVLTYSVSIVDGGSGYSTNDTLTISGSDLGGTDPANNATVTIDPICPELHLPATILQVRQ